MQKSKLQFKIQKRLLIVVFLFIATPVFAAEVGIDAESRSIGVGEHFEAGFFLNTENEDINAVEGAVVFPRELLELKEIRDGNSIINFWIEKPKAISENEVRFSGIIPGGYADKKGLVLSLVFQARQEGSGIIEIRDITALRNDGKGTEAYTTVSNLRFVVSGVPAIPKAPILKKDKEPPEPFEPIISRDPEMFEGKWFLVFSSQDKGAGIDYYKVCEGKKCAIAESPYVLQNQDLDEEITVKAVDKNDNERIVIVSPQKPKAWSLNDYLILVILIIAAVAYLIWKFLWKKHKR